MSFAIVLNYAYVTRIFYQYISKQFIYTKFHIVAVSLMPQWVVVIFSSQ